MSGRYKTILFDLDGTLTDSLPGITRSVAFALDQAGVPYDEARLKKAVGPPLLQSFTEAFGMGEQAALRAISIYRERFEKTGMLEENRLYPGVLDMLRTLKDAGFNMAIVTNKPEPYAVRIAEHFGMAPFLSGVYGCSFAKPAAEKIEALNAALAASGTGPESAVMVGDRVYDMEAAKLAGTDAVGVLYGYGGEAELSAWNPVFLAENVAGLTKFLYS